MATSFTRTREQVRDMVARKLGIKEEGQTLPSEYASIIFEGIDLRLKELHTRNTLWWQVSGAAADVALTAGVATATAPDSMLFPVTLKVRIGAEDRDVEIVGHRQYHDIPSKADRGEPEMAFFDGSTVYLWPVPQTNYTAKLTFQAIADDTAANTRPDVPVSMLRSLAAVVADDLVEDFSISDAMRVQRLAIKAKEGMRDILALAAERVDTSTITPEWF